MRNNGASVGSVVQLHIVIEFLESAAAFAVT